MKRALQAWKLSVHKRTSSRHRTSIVLELMEFGGNIVRVFGVQGVKDLVGVHQPHYGVDRKSHWHKQSQVLNPCELNCFSELGGVTVNKQRTMTHHK